MGAAIKASNISKSYHNPNRSEAIKVLDGLDLTLPKGQVCGIIGANGSGKSTLLRIFSGIVAPDDGVVEIEGKMAAILELGTGFHPDLSGRDNIYFNAGLLGYDRRYVDKVFSKIVDFSGLENYMDMPVKNYSTGMYMRLAFSVAVFLKTEILLLDEVFAVGDQDFRQKCMHQLKSMKEENVSILLVSHDFSQIASICDRCILLEGGKIADDGTPGQVIDSYVRKYFGKGKGPVEEAGKVLLHEDPHHQLIKRLEVQSPKHFEYKRSEPVELTFVMDKAEPSPVHLSFVLYYRFNELSLGSASFYTSNRQGGCPLSGPGVHIASCEIPGGLLNTGHFILELYLLDQEANPLMIWSNACMILIRPDVPPDPLLDGKPPQSSIFVKGIWTTSDQMPNRATSNLIT